MRWIAAALLFLLSAIQLLAGDVFTLPEGAKEVRRTASAKTWQVTGILDLAFAEAKAELDNAVKAAGFTLKHEIWLDPKTPNLLVAWRKETLEIIVMIQQMDTQKTRFMYGVVQ